MDRAADRFLNAAAIASAGAGTSIAPQDVEPAAGVLPLLDRGHPVSVATAIQAPLDEDRYRDAARRVADEIASMPSPDEVAAELETLV